MNISCLLPTRQRPAGMIRLADSIFTTASDPDSIEIIFYIDNDDLPSKECADKLKEKYNIKDDVATNIKETANKIAEAESNIETLSEEIVDGKKKVSKSLGVKSKGKTIVGFD